MTDTEELELYALGINPYVLVELVDDPEAPEGYAMKVKGGGGVGSANDVVAMLLTAIEALTGIPADAYALTVDEARRAAGV